MKYFAFFTIYSSIFCIGCGEVGPRRAGTGDVGYGCAEMPAVLRLSLCCCCCENCSQPPCWDPEPCGSRCERKAYLNLKAMFILLISLQISVSVAWT
jgi:hypothetical protein